MYPVWVEAVLTATYLINRIPSKFLLEASLLTLIQKYLAAILFFLFFFKERKLTKESELNETSEASSKRRSVVEGNEIETQREIRSEIRQKEKSG